MAEVFSFKFVLNYPTEKKPTTPTISKVGWIPDPVLPDTGEKRETRLRSTSILNFRHIERQTDRQARIARMAGFTLTACRF